MKHGRDYAPFRRERTRHSYRYVTNCAECEREFSVGAPRNLPDQVVVKKFEQMGMTGRGHAAKDVPRELVCEICNGGSKMENVLYDYLPREPEQLGVRRVRHSAKNWPIRFQLPASFGVVMRDLGVHMAARLVRMGNGGVRFKFKIVEPGSIPRGGQNRLEGEATKWFSVQLSESMNRPKIQMNESIVEQLIGGPVSTVVDKEQKVGWLRTSDKSYKEKGEPAVAYECADLGAVIGVAQEQPEAAQTEEANEAEAEAAAPNAEPEAEHEEAKPQPEPSDFSVEGSLRELRRALEEANLHIVNLTDKGWQPEINVTADGLIRVKVSQTLS